MTPGDPDELIGTIEVAEILGLSHRNSVSTYRRRYPGFPVPQPSPLGGRTLLWRRGEILAWNRDWADPLRPRRDPSGSLDMLVEAATTLLLGSPGTEIGVRQIAAAAGITHSDVYRYADSKEQILALAAERLIESFRTDLPGSLTEVVEHRQALVRAALQREGAMRVIMADVVRDPHAGLAPPTPARALAELIRTDRATHGRTGAASPEATAATAAAILWGWGLLGPRMCQVLGLPEIPIDEVAEILRVVVES